MIYLLSLICAALPTYLIRFSIFGIPTTALEMLIYLAIAAQIVLAITKLKRKNEKVLMGEASVLRRQSTTIKNIKLSYILYPLILLIIAVIISTIISPDKRVALGIAKGWFFDPILLFFLIILNVKSERDLGKIVYGLATGAAFVSLWGILQWFGFDYLLPHQRADVFNSFQSYLAAGRAFGPFESPNYLGMYIAPIAALTLGYRLNFQFSISNFQKKSNFQRPITNNYLLSFFLVSMLLALLFTKSLGAWLGFGTAAIFLGYFILKLYFLAKPGLASRDISHKSVFRISYLIFLISIIVAGYFLLNKIGTGRITDSFAARKEVWQVSWYLIKHHPIFGIGLGTFRSIYEQTIPTIHFPPINWLQMHPHNIFLAFWLSTGILGLISFVWILYLFVKRIFLIPNSYRIISISLMATMIAILTHGLIDSTYWKNDLSAMFWITVALAFVNWKAKENDSIS